MWKVKINYLFILWTRASLRSAKVAKWLQRYPLRYLFQWKGSKSTLLPSFITFSEREPVLRGFLWWNSLLVTKAYWGLKRIWKKFEKFAVTFGVFFLLPQFYDTGVWQKSHFWWPHFSVIKLNLTYWKEIFIGFCLRKVYWKILHCMLWRISTNALTHVLTYQCLHPHHLHDHPCGFHDNYHWSLCDPGVVDHISGAWSHELRQLRHQRPALAQHEWGKNSICF